MKLRARPALKRAAKSAFAPFYRRWPRHTDRARTVPDACPFVFLPRVADDGCAFNSLRPLPQLDRRGRVRAEKRICQTCRPHSPSICPNVFGLNCLIGMSEFAADRDRCKFPTCSGMNLRGAGTLKREAKVGLHFRFREGRAIHCRRPGQAGRTRWHRGQDRFQGASAYVAPRGRFCLGEQGH